MFGIGNKAAGVSIEQTGIRYISFKNNQAKQVHKKRFMPLLPGMIVENQVADSEALLDRLKQWVKTKGLRGSAVNLSIPPSQMIIRKMTIPSTAEKQIDQLVKLEVETGLHLPFENPVYDYVITGQNENESQLIIFAAPRKVVQDYVDVLEEAGLKIKSVEVSATALARSIVAGYGHSFNETMLIHLEQSLLDIYMFRSGNPVFMRTINLVDLGRPQPLPFDLSKEQRFAAEAEAEAATAASQDHLSAEQIVEITAEISRMLSFYQYSLHDGSTRITELLITGAPDMRRELQQELQAALPELAIAPIAADQFAAGVRPDNSLNDYRVAAGAALRDPKLRNINLLPREDRESIVFPYLAVTLAAVWVLGAVGTGILYASVRGEYDEQRAQLQSVQEQNAALQLELASLNNSGAGSGSFDRAAIIAALSASRVNAAAVLNELQSKLPYAAAIREISFSFRGDLLLTVNFTDMAHSGAYLTSLRGMPFAREAAIEKLTEGGAGTGTAGGSVSNLIKYTAVYRVNMAPEAVELSGADVQAATEEGADISGTD
ncbi:MULTISPECIES: pilus assembly protein PilM [unclassified Paenibacillus]|uniref:type IV pilus biogenesis protein PilM n=1 Tax=unclassified Paenibacillus TaxID=185978 RepID=UPI002405240A|nr:MULTISPECIES: pilus assembly protein PilM [unclassified Paenibacillus]MDF9840172.1 type IV pilus assembly protein PilN [Paenibacillus sp. PastF-2]MDF9846754.1 type IV pilus assembly protein PilN [Paenibacillus sp. PastM-2]MDF9852897.1 type IV pilus assembly protein PilN [Paenibacillus sp. PastF-1]MDH6478598.1 type IV pilus assembly protein PilN [Paenibacillus sp. PastH-2]MDH6505904.1 type IV pilus assembly protein PilN [Paenibacillus sp. PastM-3]